MLETGGNDVGWLAEAMGKLEKTQEGQEPEKFEASPEQAVEGVKCPTHRIIKARGSPSLVHCVQGPLSAKEGGGQTGRLD